MRTLLLLLALTLPAVAQTLDAVTQPVEEPSALPDGAGRDETFYTCVACHSTAIIRRSALDRVRWDGLMDWMVEKHGMNPLEGEERRVIVDYLAQAFPPRAAPGRARSPFLP